MAMYSPWTKIVGTGIFILYFFSWVFVMSITCAWLILFHLSYYNVAHRISLLTSFIRDGNTTLNSKKKRTANKLRTCGYIFDQICQVSKEIATTFSLTVLCYLTVLAILSATSLFYCFHHIYRSHKNFEAFNYLIFFINSFSMFVSILKSAQLPATEVTNV